ncbi:hypothetical protein [Pontibacter ruber]|uniref:SPOR domain-containing protein n=1 Tax=Pontibacter ruber TaxID=1343895 RepID=A0ABW5D114_9BACT|nr:hypothetical protein [Pontibacter ruber]
MKNILPFISTILVILVLSSCRQESVSPIRNVKFDPNLLNPVKAGNTTSCVSHTYYYGGTAKDLGVVYSKMVLVAFDEGLTQANVSDVVMNYGFVAGLGTPISSNSASLYPVELVAGLSCAQVEQAISELQSDASIAYAAPCFLSGGTQLLGISNEFIVTLTDSKDAEMQLNRLTKTTGTAVVTSLGNQVYVLGADKNSDGNALEMANYFQGQRGVANAEPDFLLWQTN